MRSRSWLVAAALTGPALAVPAQAGATITIDGHGFGHGVGMSQYGAYGYALREHRSAAFILGHYYTGTTLGTVGAVRVRVRLRRTAAPKVCSASWATDARGRKVKLSERRAYRFTRAGTQTLRVVDTTSNRRRASLRAPVRITGGQGVCLRGTAENGIANGQYRGALRLVRDATSVLVVDDVHIRHYLYGVVPSEMPTSWSIEAVRAQAIAARTYTMRNLRPDRDFDVFSDVRSQQYGGRGAETTRGRSAVTGTDGRVVLYNGALIDALYHSSSGGRTASNEEAFGSDPAPYLRSVEDPHDDLSPLHTWRVTLRNATAQQRLGDNVQGTLQSLAVTRRGPSGRALQVAVRGTGGTTTVAAGEVRRLLGLRSTWFDFV
ncbi:MAG: stage sporulation protein [Solirubrobacteraceae bacterium]|jgi:stage II sporulation protein D|nr:stage sporulation protein [Solirubrobacteraceae bacterium]